MQTGTVKWFDPKRGFGFVVSPDGEDILLHVTTLRRDGFNAIGQGASVDYERCTRRAYATRVIAVRDLPECHVAGDVVHGVVKWFHRDKGMGFIRRDHGADVLVTPETLRASYLASLNPGDRVSAVIERRPHGDRALIVKMDVANAS